MAQTLSGLAELAKNRLDESFNQDPKADKQRMVDAILGELTPSEVSEILHLASLNPELLDESAILAITKNVHNTIKNSLQEELSIIQEGLDAKQQELIDKQAALDAEKAELDDQSSNIDDLSQAISNIGQ